MRVCDRCGEKPVVEILGSLIDHIQYDLCKDCKAVFDGWLKPGPDDDEPETTEEGDK